MLVRRSAEMHGCREEIFCVLRWLMLRYHVRVIGDACSFVVLTNFHRKKIALVENLLVIAFASIKKFDIASEFWL